jgi:hypothetical protein
MYCISLNQPYASLVAIGAKRWETRPFRISKNHGIVAIAATAKTPKDCQLLLDQPDFRQPIEKAGLDPEALPLGVIVAAGQAEVAITTTQWIRQHCRRLMKFREEREYIFGDYSPGRFATFFPIVKRLAEPVKVRGMQGLYKLPPDVAAQVKVQLAAKDPGPAATVCGGAPPY